MPVISQELVIVLSVLTFGLSTFLGSLIFLQNTRHATNRLFGVLALIINIYIVVNYFSVYPFSADPAEQLLWIRIVMFVTATIGPTLVLLVHTFPKKQVHMNKGWIIALFSLMIVTALAALGPFVFTGIEYPDGEPVPIPGPAIPLFIVDFVGMFLVSFGVIISKFFRAQGIERKQLAHLFIGSLISFTLMGLLTVIFVVLLQISSAVILGSIAPVVLLFFIAYSIVKFQLFNLKIIVTKFIIALLIIILVAKLVLFQSITAFIVDVFVLGVMIVFGYLLVQSVSREIAQRTALDRLAGRLKKTNAQLKDLDQLKTEFLSIATHQLRTPLSIIKGYISLLDEGAYGRVTKSQRDIFHNIDISNERLVKLVDEFLNISRIEQGRTKYSFEMMDMKDVIQSAVTELQEKATPKQIHIAVHMKPVPHIIGDADRLRHCVYNFVDNAIKYSDTGSTIDVYLASYHRGISVRIVDSGPGLDEKDIKNLFQKFYRSPHVSRDFEGTGLGIYVVKEFVEAHGGDVWAKSDGLGKGSEFGFYIPKKPRSVHRS